MTSLNIDLHLASLTVLIRNMDVLSPTQYCNEVRDVAAVI